MELAVIVMEELALFTETPPPCSAMLYMMLDRVMLSLQPSPSISTPPPYPSAAMLPARATSMRLRVEPAFIWTPPAELRL